MSDIHWYSSIKKEKGGLLHHSPYGHSPHEIIVSIEKDVVIRGKLRHIRCFSYFHHYLDFFAYYQPIVQEERCFYEVIMGDRKQKPHFDIDCSTKDMDPNTILHHFLTSLHLVCKQLQMTLQPEKDILVFQSHGSEKLSFHIILPFFFHENHQEAKAFYQLVVDSMDPAYREFVDSAVYSSLQNFRMIGSQKRGSNRIKSFVRSFTFHNKVFEHEFPEEPYNNIHEEQMAYEESLISVVPNQAKRIILLDLCQEQRPRPFESHEQDDLSDDRMNEALTMCAKRNGCDSVYSSDFPFSVISCKGSLILLKRHFPSYCEACEREHQNENPYVRVGQNGDVVFYCRRHPLGAGYRIGWISSVIENKELHMESNESQDPDSDASEEEEEHNNQEKQETKEEKQETNEDRKRAFDESMKSLALIRKKLSTHVMDTFDQPCYEEKPAPKMNMTPDEFVAQFMSKLK